MNLQPIGRTILIPTFITLFFLISCQHEHPIVFNTDSLQIELDRSGFITGLVATALKENYVPAGEIARYWQWWLMVT